MYSTLSMQILPTPRHLSIGYVGTIFDQRWQGNHRGCGHSSFCFVFFPQQHYHPLPLLFPWAYCLSCTILPISSLFNCCTCLCPANHCVDVSQCKIRRSWCKLSGNVNCLSMIQEFIVGDNIPPVWSTCLTCQHPGVNTCLWPPHLFCPLKINHVEWRPCNLIGQLCFMPLQNLNRKFVQYL